MEFESSYAEAATRRHRSRWWRPAGYDVSRMNWHPPESAGGIGDPLFDDHDTRPEQKRVHRLMRRLVSAIILLLVLGIVAGIAVFAFTKASGTDIVAGERVKIVIPNGSSRDDVAQLLEKKGVKVGS